MRLQLTKFYEFLARPLFLRSRVLLALLTIPLICALYFPLWKISMEAPQYPQGLHMDVYAYKLVGGNDGHDIDEINTLNHYIGMRKLDQRAFADLDFLPFFVGALVLLTLRVAAIGSVHTLVDLTVLSLYGGAFAFGRFIYQLYVYGHDLSPTAPVKVKPFTPVILGTKDVANFTTHSYPQLGTLLIGVFLGGLVFVLFLHLWIGRKRALDTVSVPDAAHQ